MVKLNKILDIVLLRWPSGLEVLYNKYFTEPFTKAPAPVQDYKSTTLYQLALKQGENFAQLNRRFDSRSRRNRRIRLIREAFHTFE
jgi:hypothetical protein